MKVKELTEWLENKYPAKAAEHWDNVGLLVGDDEAEVSHIFLALDLTEETLEEANPGRRRHDHHTSSDDLWRDQKDQ